MDNNSINLAMRQTPWYQQWFQSKGLDPNHVKLDDQQRQELAATAGQHGMPLPHNTIMDASGNVGDHHGFAGQPGWLKALEIGGAGTAAAMFGGPALMGLMGHGAAPGLASSLGDISGVANASTAAASGGSGLAASLGDIAGVAGASTKAANGPGSFMSNLMGHVPGSPGSLADAGSVLGSFSEAEANNRMAKGNLTQNHDQLMLSAAANKRADETDALRKLAQTSYINSGGSQFKPPTISLSGQQRTAPDLGFGPRPSSDAQKQAATTLEQQLLQRMQPGGSYTPAPLSDYANRGKAESASNYGSTILGGLGAVKSLFGF